MPPDPPFDNGSEDRWERVTSLFLELVSLEPARRQKRLEAVRVAEPGLRSDVERLLDGHAAREPRFPESLDEERAARLLQPVEDGLPPGIRIGPYEIERQLGQGGMGIVYVARDSRLDRPVALKLPPPHLAHDPVSRRRLMAEARAASGLDHPRIATVYDVGETEDGRLYIAMVYCEGRTLEEMLTSEPLPIDQAVSIAAQIAEALACAHTRGIVHRDIKPGNVMVAADGSVRLVDFGVAKASGRDLTGAGMRMGTVAYMSPEQTRGESVDARTDLWSLGVVLYQMLAGRHPFPAEDLAVRVHAIRHDDPTDLRRMRPDTPADLAALVTRCLAKNPADRPSSADEVLAGLSPAAGVGNRSRRMSRQGIGVAAISALALAGAAALLVLGDRPQPEATAVSDRVAASHRLALLPFRVHGSDTTTAVLAAGLTEDLGGRLSGYDGVRLIARGSVERLVKEQAGLVELGRRLDVDAVLEGSLRQEGSRVFVTARLLDPVTGGSRWASEYEAAVESLPAISEEIVGRVAAAVDPTRRSTAPAGRGTDNFDAYLNYLRGRYYWSQRTAAGIERGKKHFERALDLDPTYARAWSGLADAHILLGSTGMMKAEDAFPRAREASLRALEIDPDLAAAHASLGAALADYYWDWGGAERAFRSAIELDPDYAIARYWYSELLAYLGRTDEAIQMARRAREIDPLSQLARADEGRAYYLGRRYDEALTIFRETLDLGPQFIASLYMGLAYSQLGRHEEAIAAMDTLRTSYPRFPEGALLGYVLARAGRRAEAEEVLTAARQSGDPPPIMLAVIHAGLGNVDQAFANLERAYEKRAWQLVMLKQEPVFDPLRSDPRYAELLDRLKLD